MYIPILSGSSYGKRVWISAVAVGLLGALAMVVVGPLLLILGLVGMAVAVSIPLKGQKVFLAYMAFLLLGYLFLGKGFAYIGVAPLYLAEVGLALAAATALTLLLLNRLKGVSFFLQPITILLLAFLVWQALCTIPYLGTYKVDAIRDAALWGYAAFALSILLLVPRNSVDKLFTIYGKVLPYYLAWLPIAWILMKVDALSINFPGSPVSLLHLKSGDVGVHLAGAAAFMLLRLDSRESRWSNAKLWFMWGLWGISWIAYGSNNRAGMLSALLGIGIVLLWRPMTRWYRPLVLATLLVGLLFLTNFSASVSLNDERAGSNEVSAQQITANVASVFGGDSGGNLSDTREWRLNWWQKIVGYTFGGEYFWTGRGYGINLANEDGFQVDNEEESVRNPHNGFMTILARSGVPGLTLWLLFLASFGLLLIKKASTKGGGHATWSSRYALWLLAYWLAFLFNASFDVFLEGPMGGVWFWSIVGMGLVYFLRTERLSKGRSRTLTKQTDLGASRPVNVQLK